MNKKKLVTLAMALSMVAILAIGGTIAYFTDYDYNTNVMVLGNVKLDQIEQERVNENDDQQGPDEDENGMVDGMVDYVDGRPLYPLTAPVDPGRNEELDDPNVVDKFVSVKNTGKSDAFIRTLFAFEKGKAVTVDPETNEENVEWVSVLGSQLFTVDNGLDTTNLANIVIDEVEYEVMAFYYNDNGAYDSEGYKTSALEPDAQSEYSLKQIYLNADVTNDFFDLIGEEYKILVLSQATQTEGFTTAKDALDTAFGEVTDTNCTEWFQAYYGSEDAENMDSRDTSDDEFETDYQEPGAA